MGLLDALTDPVLMAEIAKRRQLIEHLANWAGCGYDEARIWLDWQDAEAISTAERILAAEPYTDIPVAGWYH